MGLSVRSVTYDMFCLVVHFFDIYNLGGGGCNPKKPNPYPRKGQTGIGFFWVFLGFLNIAILAE